MDEPAAIAVLHLAARRYLVDRHAELADQYERQQRARAFAAAATTDDDDRRLFARTVVLQAMLSAVEHWLPADATTLDDARARLVEAAWFGDSPQSRLSHPLATEAMVDERARFERFATRSTPDQWAAAAPLPFRRVLDALEAHELDRAFVARWGHWFGGAPDRADLPPHLTVHVGAWHALPLGAALRGFLAAAGVDRLYELREFDDSYQLAPALATFTSDGREGRWFVDGCEWMLYASHASTLTLGGDDLLAHLRAALPSLEDFVPPGPDDGA